MLPRHRLGLDGRSVSAPARSKLASRLLELLPDDGTPRSNPALRALLRVSKEEYFAARDSLVEDGTAVRLRGRGGSTARVAEPVAEAQANSHPKLKVLAVGLLILGGITLLAAAAYAAFLHENQNWPWNAVGLAFGGVTVAAAGLSLLIYIVQDDATRIQGVNQEQLLDRITGIASKTERHASETRAAVIVMRGAIEASSVQEAVEAAELAEDVNGEGEATAPEPDLAPEDEGWITERPEGKYYLPPAVPLYVVSDLVQWWADENEKGRWTIDRLVSGFRAFNTVGTTTGKPWILTFNDGRGGVRSFRLAYSGKRKGPLVSELTDPDV